MACCFLADVPAVAFQAVLRHLDLQDHASLRQVSSAVCKRTTHHVPYITMPLTDSGSATQLQTWNRVTQRLQHVTSVHIHLTGRIIAANMFELAMQLLSQRTNSIAELHLLAVNIEPHGSSATVASLQPIIALMPQLRTLVIEGIVSNLPYDLYQIATAAPAEGWQLQSLVLKASWYDLAEITEPDEVHWWDFPAALYYFTKAWPGLTHLDFKFPSLKWHPLVSPDLPTAHDLSTLIHESYDPPGSRCDYRQVQLAQVAAVAALANAVQHLQHLKTLAITNMPNLWKQGIYGHELHTNTVPSALGSATTAPAPATAVIDDFLRGGALSSVSTAAEALFTLDDCGCWLLQQHPSLTGAAISTMDHESEWKMTWYQQQQQPQIPMLSNLARGQQTATASATEDKLTHANISCCLEVASYDFTGRIPASSSEDSRTSLTSRFIFQLSQYSSRPAAWLMDKISSCSLKLYHEDADGLAHLLYSLRSLKHLQVIYRCSQEEAVSDKQPSALPAVIVIDAAASMQNLQSLTLQAYLCTFDVSDALLLPLTAAAGGPGSKLKKLELSVSFESRERSDALVSTGQTSDVAAAATTTAVAADRGADIDPAAGEQSMRPGFTTLPQDLASLKLDTAADTATMIDVSDRPGPSTSGVVRQHTTHSPTDTAIHVVADSSNSKACSGCQHLDRDGQPQVLPTTRAAADNDDYDIKWHHALRQLDGLQELVIWGEPLLDLPVESLPASLKVLKGGQLNIMSVSSAASAAAAAADFTAAASSNKAAAHAACIAGACPELQVLDLDICQVSSPGVLSSNELHELTLCRCTWSGGWEAAGAAWPYVRRLKWYFDEDFSATGRPTSGHSETASILQAIADGFRDTDGGTMSFTGSSIPSTAVARCFEQSTDISISCFKGIASAFLHLGSLEMHEVPWVSVDLLYPLVHPLHNMQHFILTLYPSSCGLGLDPYQVVLLRVEGSNKRVCRVVKHPDITLVERWLHKEVPWARVHVK